MKVPLLSQVNIECEIAASPQPTIYWSKLDNEGNNYSKCYFIIS